MALDSSNVRVAVTGALSMAPTTAPAPKDSSTPLPQVYGDLGYVHEDGIKESRERDTEQIKAWQHADVVREAVTEAKMTYELTLIETKAETVSLYYGSKVDPGDGSIAIIPAKTGGRHSFVLDVIDEEFIRAYIPSGEVTEVGEIEYKTGQPIGYPITLTAYPSLKGYSVKKFYSSLVVKPAKPADPEAGKAN